MSFVSSARMHIDAFIKGIFVNKTNGYLSTCIPANILRTSNQIEKLMNKNSDITDEDLCKQLNLPISRINRAKEYLYNYGISSMNATINEEGETYEHYLGNNDENFKKFEESDKNNIIFKTLFKNIDQSKLNILKMYYGINDEEHEYTVKEIAKELKLDESIVRKHINSTLSECKKNAKTIKSYL
jgi:DNA-directed RNA polymerase specialized sigma subunit